MFSNPSGNDVFILVLTDPEQLKQTTKRSDPEPVKQTTTPSEAQPFWKTIKETIKAKAAEETKTSPPLVIVLNADHLRESGINISRGISWERTAYDLTTHIRANTTLGELAKDVHLVVRLGLSGVLHYNGTTETPLSLLYYDSEHIEGEYENSMPGRVPGYSALLATTIAVQLLEEIESHFIAAPPDHEVSALDPKAAAKRDRKEPDRKEIAAILTDALDKAIRQGIANCRTYHRDGVQASCLRENIQNWDQSLLRGDNKRDAAEGPIHIKDCSGALVAKIHRIDVVDDRKWTILGSKRTDYIGVSIRIVQRGFAEACKGGESNILATIPVLNLKQLMTVDREEIESYRSIRNLVIEYHNKRTQKPKPISIAVFGPPGSGKSFGVKQIAESIQELNPESITYNLAQFNVPDELALAFIKSRDISLQGKTPIIFFDEFDCKFQEGALGWLKYFLSPMQDGQFKHGEDMLNIGKAIFVFAGGMNRTYQEFCHDDDEEEGRAAFRHAKGVDFISRLRGFINIIGLDQDDKRAKNDEVFVMRRALVLRSVLETKYERLLENNGDPIDNDVLLAMLKVGRYKHGVRSMEAILEMSTLSNATKFAKSHLPSEAQLDMHVDSYEFLKLMREGGK